MHNIHIINNLGFAIPECKTRNKIHKVILFFLFEIVDTNTVI